MMLVMASCLPRRIFLKLLSTKLDGKNLTFLIMAANETSLNNSFDVHSNQINIKEEPYDDGFSKKRSVEETDPYEQPTKKRRMEAGDGPNTMIRILVNSKDAGGIIGKGGSNIKRLREQYKATVNIPDTSCPERILSINSVLGSALTILHECIPKICESQLRNNPRDDPEIQFLVQQSQAGSIIGRGGAKIKNLREVTKTNVKVFPDCLPDSSERIVAIQGNPDNIIECVQSICETLNETPTKGQIMLYDPGQMRSFHGTLGFGGRGNRNRGGRGGSRGRGRGFGGRGGNMSSGGGPNFGHGPMDGGGVPNIFGGGNSMGGGEFSADNFNMSAGGGQVPPFDQSTTTTQVTIPKDLAGSIIGPGGNRINRIRRDTGANVKIDEPMVGSNDRIITISGNQDQINHAQYLMQKCVREYSGKKF
ncbi:heterogeneous nuclear ribonucleoprotein K-like isoform X2 [Xenia sp. Carnegie-2017]|uniref:heterogeneous nuclear ribonucleoprotein K-like isoform X2 n=1 Tax=Xenia sp. Carnegie-2017 TaxID=2897299 RepID=UPI001F03E972|nr:heterogeneous nuclear ribonucleoprotein K-like isoform X2 [Xenia sp. Carnegie-2017]